jgi:CRP-like cAMP-binding protein
VERIIAVLEKSFLTKRLSQNDFQILAHAMQERTYEQGETIILYGDVGREYFILNQGTVEILVYKEGTNPSDPDLANKIAFTKMINQAMGFGEIALITNDKRTATVKAAAPTTCWVLEGRCFKQIIIKQMLTRKNIQPTFLDTVEMFSKMDRYDKLKLLDMLNTKVLN